MAQPPRSSHESHPSSPHTTESFDYFDGDIRMGHFSNSDYDWMGVLDTFGEEHHAVTAVGAVNVVDTNCSGHTGAEDHESSAQIESQGTHIQQVCVLETSNATDMHFGHLTYGGATETAGGQNNPIMTQTELMEIVEQSLAMTNYQLTDHAQSSRSNLGQELSDGSRSASDPLDDCEKPTASQASSLPSRDFDGDGDAKNCSRVERKRNREKQRRLDTNSQFNNLAAIVREIENFDFVEEAQYDALNKNFPLSNQDLSQDKAIGVARSRDSAEADHLTKKQKSEASFKSIFPGGSVQSALSAAGAYGSSNRVELIAKTTIMLSQFRAIRKRRVEELRDAKRLNCEMRKEMEEMRRLVAHYKTLGMGQQRPQEKIMMMVPMMVPQDAVHSLSSSYPASHPCGSSFSAPWMSAASFAHALPSTPNVQYQQENLTNTASVSQLSVSQTAQHAALQYNLQQAARQSQAVATFPHQTFQQQSFQNHLPGVDQSTNATNFEANSTSTTPTGQSSVIYPTQGMMQMHQLFGHQNSAFGMFPHAVNGAAPNLHSAANVSANQHENNTETQQLLSSDKPSPPPQGGGGNLAHCA